MSNTLAIHRVTKVEVVRRHLTADAAGPTFNTIGLLVHDKDGTKFEITLYTGAAVVALEEQL